MRNPKVSPARFAWVTVFSLLFATPNLPAQFAAPTQNQDVPDDQDLPDNFNTQPLPDANEGAKVESNFLPAESDSPADDQRLDRSAFDNESPLDDSTDGFFPNDATPALESEPAVKSPNQPALLPSTLRAQTDPERERAERDDAVFSYFEGDDFLKDIQTLAPEKMSIRVRRTRIVNAMKRVGNQMVPETKNVVYFEHETVAPKTADLTPEQRLGVVIGMRERELAKINQALAETEDDAERDKLLAKLRVIYTERFEIDTMYQDYKVRKIEIRAAKLRADVKARDKALGDWVDAMVTLAKMRASGIETMPTTPGPQPPSFGSPLTPPGMSLPPASTTFSPENSVRGFGMRPTPQAGAIPSNSPAKPRF